MWCPLLPQSFFNEKVSFFVLNVQHKVRLRGLCLEFMLLCVYLPCATRECIFSTSGFRWMSISAQIHNILEIPDWLAHLRGESP